LAFGEVLINFSDSLELTVKNIGNDVLSISNISFDKTVFSVPRLHWKFLLMMKSI